jgi:hypothetical protein
MTAGDRLSVLLAVGFLAILGCLGCTPRVLRMAEARSHFDARYIPTDGDSMRAPFLDLAGRLERWGITIADLPEQDGAFGRASLEQRTIWIKRSLSVNAQFEVLAHEAGHLLQPPALADDALSQLFAELVGVGVQHFYGSATADETGAAYLSQFKYTFGAARAMRHDIDYAVKALTGQVDLPEWRHP